MANSNFQAHKLSSLLLTITIITFFLLLLNGVNSSEVLSFQFEKFSPNQPNLLLQGDALVTSTGKIQLTKVVNNKPVYQSLGRALYSTPIHLWDNTTGNVASFNTSFDFVIKAPDVHTTADGLAFFMAPVDTQPGSKAGCLGLFNCSFYSSSSQIVAVESDTQIVAVEFDTFSNLLWDVDSGPHIGIDVNSIVSRKTTPFDLRNGDVGSVLISYLASSKTLVASLVYPSGKTGYIVSARVDLKKVLPEWVRVGFSATTGYLFPFYVETHDILNWSFKSKLKTHSGTPGEDDEDLEDEIDLVSFMGNAKDEVSTN